MATQQTPPQPPQPVRPTVPKPLKIVQHSQLFYWWPVWLMSFILGIVSWIDGSHMVVVPKDSIVEMSGEERYTLTVPGSPPVAIPKDADGKQRVKVSGESGKDAPFPIHMSDNKNLGVIWAMTLILVIFITNVPLRGMWSVVILVTVVLVSIIFITLGVWSVIFGWLTFLSIFMNAGGYFFIGTALLIFWAVTVFLFDQQTYWIFTPGQLRIHEAIGGGEKAFDTRGMTTEKHRDDLFRHWILGLGTGDLTVKTAGAESREFRIQNVWWVGHKLTQIQELQRIHQETAGR